MGTLVTGGEALSAGTTLEFTISNVNTPSSVTSQGVEMDVMALTSSDGMIDASRMLMDEIESSEIVNAAWDPNNDSPGATAVTATVSFHSISAVPTNGKIVLDLPDDSGGWRYS